MPNDIRRKIKCRQIILDLADNTNTPFSKQDLEWIAENIEVLLQQRYDVKIECIDIKDL
jgi:hypothetical protein